MDVGGGGGEDDADDKVTDDDRRQNLHAALSDANDDVTMYKNAGDDGEHYHAGCF